MIPIAEGSRQHAQGAVRQALVVGQDGGALFLRHGHGLAALPAGGAAAQDLVRRAFGVLHPAAVGLVHGGHHLAAGIKGRFIHTGRGGFQFALGQPQLGGVGHQSGLGGLALGLALVVQVGVAAGVVHHGHLVLGQGAGLVRADDLGAAQRFDGGQFADDRIALGHIGHADGKHHRDHGRQTLGDGGHSQGDSHHEGGQHGIQIKPPGGDQVEHKNEHADAQHQLGQGLAQLVQLFLQRGLLLLGSGQRARDLAHLGIHAGAGDQRLAAAIDHRGAHITHVFAVAQGHILLAVQVQRFDDLMHRHALAGQGRFLDLQAGALQQAAVGGHCIAGFQHHHVTGHQLVGMQQHLFAVAQHLAGGGSHRLQGFNGRFGLALLVDAQDSVEQHHDQDDEHFGEAFAREVVGHRRDRSRHHQDDQHRVFQLFDEPLQKRRFGCLLQAVGAVLLQAFRSLGPAQALCGDVQLLQKFTGRLGVLLFHWQSFLSEKFPLR